jgi:DNA repair protein RecO (recombination protein O)
VEWSDDGIILGLRRHGEGHAVAELMTAAHGRHLGLVRGGGSRKMAPMMQPGNSVRAVWQARLDEHLGSFRLEITEARSDRVMGSARASYALQTLAFLLRLLPERDPHRNLYEQTLMIADCLHETRAAPALARFELRLLSELGFGLDLGSCAASGSLAELVFVSPKSGRAVSRAAAGEWESRLLRLPAFLQDDAADAAGDLDAAFALTGHFLVRHVLEPRGLVFPDARAAFLAAAGRDRAA